MSISTRVRKRIICDIARGMHLQEELKMPSMRFNARLDTSHYGPPYPYKDTRAVADSLTGIHGAAPFSSSQELHTQGLSGFPASKNPED
jgi:hypothetical protein